MITAAELRSILHYDPLTGLFRWRVKMGQRALKGAIAGHTRKTDGYHIIIIHRRKYKAHRLAWLYVHGVWPKPFADHRNCVRHDNRIANLRESTRSQNNANRPAITGLKGASWNRSQGKWVARIRKDNVEHHLGAFTTEEAAHAAYCNAAPKFHGEFARTS